MGKIELFINSLDFSDYVAEIIPKEGNRFIAKLRKVGKANRLAKQAGLYTGADERGYIAWADVGKTRVPIVVYCNSGKGQEYSFSDSYLDFEHGTIGISKRNKPHSFATNIGGGFAVPEEFAAQLTRNLTMQMAQAVRIPRRLIEPVVDDTAESARQAWDGVAPYSVGIDAARADAELTVFARRFADATGRSAADVENDIQNAINLETSRILGREVEIRLDGILLNGDEVEGDE